MTPKKLFIRRMKAEWIFQWKAWRMAVDWTVALYIVIPALIFVLFQYVSWWKETPKWLSAIPLPLAAFILFALLMAGTVRFFIEEGDQLFLIRQKEWYRRYMNYGIRYSFCALGLATLAATALFAPLLLRVYGMSAVQLSLFTLFAYLFRLVLALVGHWTSFRYSGWRHSVAGAAVMLAGALLFIAVMKVLTANVNGSETVGIAIGAIACMMALLAVLQLVRWRIRLQGAFFCDAVREQEQKYKYVALLVGSVVPKKPKVRRQRPWLFPSSNRLFKSRTQANLLAEFGIKSLFRNRTHMKLYAQMTIIYVSAAVALPFIMKWILWGAAALLLSYYVKGCWREGMQSSFLQLFPWRDGSAVNSMRKAAFIGMLPGFLLVSLALGFSAFSWWGLLVVPIAGIAVGYASVWLVTFSGGFSKRDGNVG